ncbi:MAG: phosphate butyryltransferase [Rikenellaceae bacterium]|nr:phosphate butyryltransferase [Rikenellaceae bacterium]
MEPITTIGELVNRAAAGGPRRLVVAYGQDAHTVEAVADAVTAGLVNATLIGDPDTIVRTCRESGIDPGCFDIIPEADEVRCVEKSVRMVREGQADLLMKGLVPTDKYMRGILSKEYGLVPSRGVLTHIVVMKLPQYDRLLFLSDVAIIPNPDLSQKTMMIKHLTATARSLGVGRPKVACIAPSEQVLPSVTSSTDGAVLAKMGDRGAFGSALVDGLLALDVALVPEIVKIKKLTGSAVAGHADCLLFPNLDAANVFFKTATQLLGAEQACMVAGASALCVLTSRGDSRTTKLNSIALACLTAR